MFLSKRIENRKSKILIKYGFEKRDWLLYTCNVVKYTQKNNIKSDISYILFLIIRRRVLYVKKGFMA
jgi:hypothetical protein